MADKHKHEWVVECDQEGIVISAWCSFGWDNTPEAVCKEQLSDEEINRRLNAVEELSADDAKRAFKGLHPYIDNLLAYATTLEKEMA